MDKVSKRAICTLFPEENREYIKKMGWDIPVKKFQWRTKDSLEFIYPKDMDTRHLFFTIRMIWNNFCPEELQHPPIRMYCFAPFYTREYLKEAVKQCHLELMTRTDLTEYMKGFLKFMEDNMSMYRKMLRR